MISDTNKNITSITYNHLNLPTKITFATTGNIVYIYNAAGQKLQKNVNRTGTTAVVTDYLGGYQYESSLLKFIPTAEGYVEPSGSSYQYIYQYKDHLGNVRLSYDKTLAIKEENNYYPFGLKHNGYNPVKVGVENKYKYNGKELQDELGLNMYDYGSRLYDPALGRFSSMDPLSEKFFPLTPYNYVANSPVLLIDPNGEDWTINRTEDKSGRVHYQISFTGAVLNSSSKKINMIDFANTVQKQVESLMTSFESREDGSFDFAVTTSVSLRIIDDKDDVKNDESLIEIKNGTDKDFTSVYPKGSKSAVVARAMNGKEVSVNANYVDAMISGKNKKTMAHELGHTLGLKHPLMDVNRFGFSLLKGKTYDSPKSNFMYQGTVKNPTGPTREQMSRIYQLYVNNQLNRKDVEPVDVK